MNVIAELLVGYLILQGAILSLLSAFGVLRLQDLYTRIHAVSKTTTLGILSLLLGVFFYFWFFADTVNSRVLLGIIFLFLTAPVSSHLNARAAYNTGVPLWEKSSQDDLKTAREKLKKLEE
jgi:multicomponent Na+:H+ antiporter subunit G